MKPLVLLLSVLALPLWMSFAAAAEPAKPPVTLLNVSCDVARPFYKDLNSDPAALARHAAVFKPIELIDVSKTFGGWAKAQQVHFNDGGKFDQIHTQ